MVPSAAKGISAKDSLACSWIAGKVRRSKAKFDGPMDLSPIVGIGASAGGIEALEGFFRGQTLGLALHELTTNALKYGALKHPGGALTMAWDVRNDAGKPPVVTLDCKKTGVPIYRTPAGKGFGRELIERALVASLQAKSKMVFGSDGLSCHIELPLDPPADVCSSIGLNCRF